jgi:hypothetical protein
MNHLIVLFGFLTLMTGCVDEKTIVPEHTALLEDAWNDNIFIFETKNA